MFVLVGSVARWLGCRTVPALRPMYMVDKWPLCE